MPSKSNRVERIKCFVKFLSNLTTILGVGRVFWSYNLLSNEYKFILTMGTFYKIILMGQPFSFLTKFIPIKFNCPTHLEI